MQIIISPAKKMNIDTDSLGFEGLPCFINDTKKLMRWIQTLNIKECQKLWHCNDKLTLLNYRRFRDMDLEKNLTPAILSYEGIQYQYMAPGIFTTDELIYVQKHLRILSGFYGVLRPLDGVVQYRLEMQAKMKADGCKDLYEFWGDKIYNEVIDNDSIIINLASKEYSKIIEKYLNNKDKFITCIVGEIKDGRVIQKGTMAKMARGEMVRFMAENKVEEAEQLKKFNRIGYEYSEEKSCKDEYVFIKR